MVLSDEVYTLFTYDGVKHVPVACIPDMFERTVTLNSQGKEFSCTGWRIGTLTGPEYLVGPVGDYLRFQHGGANTHGQLALCSMLDEAELPYQGEENYWQWANKDFQVRKDMLCDLLKKYQEVLGLEVIQPEGGYTLMANMEKGIKNIHLKYYYNNYEIPKEEQAKGRDHLQSYSEYFDLESPDRSPDEAYVYWLTYEVGITAMSGYNFYYNRNRAPRERQGINEVRFSVCKRTSLFADMEQRIEKYLEKKNQKL